MPQEKEEQYAILNEEGRPVGNVWAARVVQQKDGPAQFFLSNSLVMHATAWYGFRKESITVEPQEQVNAS